LKTWWAIISKVVRWRPLLPTESRSSSLMQGWDTVRGFAGGGTSPEVMKG
jgi:hypothetical protein